MTDIDKLTKLKVKISKLLESQNTSIDEHYFIELLIEVKKLNKDLYQTIQILRSERNTEMKQMKSDLVEVLFEILDINTSIMTLNKEIMMKNELNTTDNTNNSNNTKDTFFNKVIHEFVSIKGLFALLATVILLFVILFGAFHVNDKAASTLFDKVTDTYSKIKGVESTSTTSSESNSNQNSSVKE